MASRSAWTSSVAPVGEARAIGGIEADERQPVLDRLADRGERAVDQLRHGQDGRSGVEGVAAQLQQPAPPAGNRRALENSHLPPGPGQVQRGRQPAQPGADHHHAIGAARHRPHSSVTRPASTARWRVVRTAASIARSCVTSRTVPRERVQGRLELLDRGQVEVVGRLVQHEQVHAAPLQQGQRRPRALTRRQGGRRPQGLVGSEPELGQQGPDVGVVEFGQFGAHRAGQRGVADEQRPGLIDLADDDARAERRACPTSGAMRPSSRSSSVVLPEPLGPVIATRSGQSICRLTGPSVKSTSLDDGVAATATTAPGRGAGAISIRSCHSLRGSATSSRRSISRSVCRALAACFSLRLAPEVADELVVVGGLAAGVRDALLHPGPLHAGPRLQVVSPVGVLLVGLALVAALDLALGEVGLVAAGDLADLLLGVIELDDRGDGPVQELAIVADDDGRRPQRADEAFEHAPARRGRGRSWARRAGRRRSGSAAATASPARAACPPDSFGIRARRARRQPQLGARPTRPGRRGRLRPGAASVPGRSSRRRRRRAPARAEQLRRPRPSRAGRRPRRSGGRCSRRPSRPDGGALLRQIPDLGVGRAADHGAGVRGPKTGQDPQQGRLAGPVAADQADDIARRDHEIEPGEQRPVAVSTRRARTRRATHSPAAHYADAVTKPARGRFANASRRAPRRCPSSSSRPRRSRTRPGSGARSASSRPCTRPSCR